MPHSSKVILSHSATSLTCKGGPYTPSLGDAAIWPVRTTHLPVENQLAAPPWIGQLKTNTLPRPDEGIPHHVTTVARCPSGLDLAHLPLYGKRVTLTVSRPTGRPPRSEGGSQSPLQIRLTKLPAASKRRQPILCLDSKIGGKESLALPRLSQSKKKRAKWPAVF